ncbi:hypothetical protein [Chroococcidiopsis cubana]|nr:hypothetical protein [Chroococcidiopsis cubana]
MQGARGKGRTRGTRGTRGTRETRETRKTRETRGNSLLIILLTAL